MKYRFIFFLAIVILVLFQGCSTELNESKIRITKISSGKTIHRFFDTSPISPSGKYIALFRLPYENESPKPGESGEVIIVNLKTKKEKIIAKTFGWEVQVGANVQWGGSDEELYYNDVDTTTWEAFAVKCNPLKGTFEKMDGTVFMASLDGTKLASYNLKSSQHAQTGYGVIVPDKHATKNSGPTVNDGIFITNTKNGQERMIVSLNTIYHKTEPGIQILNPDDYEYYCFQIKWNPQGTRLLTTVQWTPKEGGKRRRAVITMRDDGTDIKTAITPEQWSKGGHHINWMPDGKHISMNLNVDNMPGLEIITARYDGSDMKTVYAPGSGHPSFHPKGLPFIITDAYPRENISGVSEGMVPIRLINVKDSTEQIIDKVFLSETSGEFRIDAHPAWDRSGRYVVYNGFEDGTRCVFITELKEILDEFEKTKLSNNL